MTELERIEQADEYFRRYLQKKEAITLNRENQEYLKTYIHEEAYVVGKFDMREKLTKSIGIAVGVGLVLFILLWLLANLIVGLIVGLIVIVGGSLFFTTALKMQLESAKKEQVEVNEGIKEQIETLEAREPQIIAEKENFAKGLAERVTFISINEMKYLPELKRMIENGEAETCEDAVIALEQKLLFEQFNMIMENKELEKTYTDAENKARFGDPLELIKKKKKKSVFGNLFGKKKNK